MDGQITIQGTGGTAAGASIDTELPAARLAADSQALPTAPDVLALMHALDNNTGTDIDIIRAHGGRMMVQSTWSTSIVSEGTGAYGYVSHLNNNTHVAGTPAVGTMLWAGASGAYHVRGNMTATALTSSARTATTNSADLTNPGNKGVIIALDVTATPNDAQTLTLEVQVKDPVSAKYVTITAYTALLASTLGATPTTETYLYTLYPGTAETAAVAKHELQALVIPFNWRVRMVHSAAGSWTYTVGLQYII